MSIFTSGSCRLLCALDINKKDAIHTVSNGFRGDINFLGKLHNVKQHIQFIKYIKNEIVLPLHIIPVFLSNYNNSRCAFGIEYTTRLDSLRKRFYDCDVYMFEICSIKIYEKDGYQVQYELTNDYQCTVQSEEDIYNDLMILCRLLPKGKKIIFQTHFRPNIIYNDPSRVIEKREIIYNIVKKFCDANENIYLYDPSVLLQTNNSLFDGQDHFDHEPGYNATFKYITENFLSS
jgi:hypothetical protein